MIEITCDGYEVALSRLFVCLAIRVLYVNLYLRIFFTYTVGKKAKLFNLKRKMSEYQFPPSSPVLKAADSDFDPFARPKDSVRGRTEYPTPNPSSTVGRSSSPARHENELASEVDDAFSVGGSAQIGKKVMFANDSGKAARERRPTVSINRDFNILNPDASVMRIPLILGRSQLLVGRSSKSCDFHLKTSDKTVSRMHVKIEYNAESLTFVCLGYNGFGMIVPRVCQVKKSENGAFELRETGKPLQALNVSKTIHLDYQHTEFHVNRGETVILPRFSNVLLQVRDHVLLVNPDDYDEEVTDDEAIELMQPHQEQFVEEKKTTLPTLPSPVVMSTTPTTSSKILPSTPQKVLTGTTSEEEPTPSKGPVKSQFVIFQDSQQPRVQPPKRALTPLSNRSTNLPTTPPVKRRAASEEPGIIKRSKQQEPERDKEGKLIIDGKSIQNVSNLSEIENILINHLAFSRLSSTPASFLNTILAAVSKLSLQQLRSVLHSVDCIGVIYRQGKDAAGKPLEEEYYYIPEKDHDPERNKLVSLIKGHGGLRACRRTHKQYYWKKPAPIKK